MKGLRLKYFVLKPCGKDAYAAASRKAMAAYAEAIASEDPQLSHELMDWYYKERGAAIMAGSEEREKRGRR